MLSRLMTRKEQFVLLFFGGTVMLGAGVLLWQNAGDSAEVVTIAPTELPPPARIAPSSDTAPPSAHLISTIDQNVVVSVQGAILNPGVYTMENADRVEDLLEEAGGALTTADLININRAARLVDGTTLTVPSSRDEGYSAQAVMNPAAYTLSGWERQEQATGLAGNLVNNLAGSGTAGSNGKIDLNRCDQAALENLPGIGPVLASSIMRFREEQPFLSVDDLQLVSGIGEKRLAAIREFVTVTTY